MAAGLGFKDFTTGEVLTAADVDGYLMQGVWVFASAAARDAAVTSPQEGNFAYLKDTNVTTYYTGSAWANLDTTGMTNPMTTTGDVIYSSSGSTPARLGIGTAGQVLQVNSGATAPEWAAPTAASFVGCSVQNSTAQSIGNATFTALTFNTENYDTDGFHSTVTNTSRMTIPTGKGGKYLIQGIVETDTNTTGQRTLAVYVNGSAENYFGNVAASSVKPKSVGNIVLSLNAGDYVELFYYQNSGTNQDALTSGANGRFTISYLGA